MKTLSKGLMLIEINLKILLMNVVSQLNVIFYKIKSNLMAGRVWLPKKTWKTQGLTN